MEVHARSASKDAGTSCFLRPSKTEKRIVIETASARSIDVYPGDALKLEVKLRKL